MTLQELREQINNKMIDLKTTPITVVFNQDYQLDNCLEYGSYNNIGYRPCLRSEKINFKKGQ